MCALDLARVFKEVYVEPVSIENERRVVQLLAEAARASLLAFPQSLEHDLTLLALPARDRPDTNRNNAILVRVGEKQVVLVFDLTSYHCGVCTGLLFLPRVGRRGRIYDRSASVASWAPRYGERKQRSRDGRVATRFKPV